MDLTNSLFHLLSKPQVLALLKLFLKTINLIFSMAKKFCISTDNLLTFLGELWTFRNHLMSNINLPCVAFLTYSPPFLYKGLKAFRFLFPGDLGPSYHPTCYQPFSYTTTENTISSQFCPEMKMIDFLVFVISFFWPLCIIATLLGGWQSSNP